MSYKFVLGMTGLVLILVFIVAVIGSIWPTQEEWFLELGLLGKEKTADLYFASANSVVSIDITNNWFIFVHNHMGQKQNILVKAKLLNSTMQLPNDLEHEPSTFSAFKTFPLSLSDKQTVLFPFSWNVQKIEVQNGLVIIKSLMINEEPVEVNVSTSVNSSFRMVFELWVQDQVTGQYHFGWQSKESFSSASLNIGFKLDGT